MNKIRYSATEFGRNKPMNFRPSGTLKGHSQLWDRADLDTSFLTLKRVHLNLKSKLRVEYVEKSASIFAVFCSIFNLKLKNLFLSVFLLILGYYFIIFG